MNLPTDYIHDCQHAFGWLVFPTISKDKFGSTKWVAYFKDYGFKVTDKFGFHNCRIHGK